MQSTVRQGSSRETPVPKDSSRGLVPAVPLPNRSQKPRLLEGKPPVSTNLVICTQSRHREQLLPLRESFMSDKELFPSKFPDVNLPKVAVSGRLRWLFPAGASCTVLLFDQ